MVCKFCGNEIEPEEKRCPGCGKKVPVLSTGTKVVISIWCVVLLAAVVAVAIFLGKDAQEPTVNDNGTVTYTVSDADAAKKANDVVATVGNTQLTNAQLQVLYRAEVYGFLNNYGYYLSSYGLDLTKGLDEQMSYSDNTITWQQYFLERALQSWKSYAVLCEMANAEGYKLSAEAQQSIADIEKNMLEDATTGGYAGIDEMVLAEGGAGATVDGFKAYQTLLYTSMDYFNTQYTAMSPTEQEVEAYYNENAAAYEEAGTGKDSGKTVDVRHILVAIAGGTTDEAGNTTYSDQDWADCLAKAEQIYQQWKDGEATENSFAQLASKVTEDPGSKDNGGLYTGVYAGQMVTEFNDWIMDESRQEGDTGLVKTEFGYHIMYYCADEAIWYTTAKSDLLSERFQEFYNRGETQYPINVDYNKIVLGQLDLS